MSRQLTHKGTRIITTERLTLRPFRLSDAEDMYNNWASDPEVARFLTWPAHEHVEITKEILSIWCGQYEYDNVYNWAIELNAEKQAIGGISVVAKSENDLSCEIGYCISRKLWGKGIVTEAFKAVIEYLFLEVGMNRIVAKHDTKNPASGRVMQKSGLIFEGISREVKCRGNDFYDLANYAIINNQFLQNRFEPFSDSRKESNIENLGYIKSLRKYVGNAPLIMAGACVLIFNKDGELLLQRRTDSGDWGTLGGAMEPGEGFEDTAKRELLEEAGVTANRYELLTVLSGKDMYYLYPNGDEIYNVMAVFIAHEIVGTPFVNDDESYELKYFEIDKPIIGINPFNAHVLRKAGIIKW
ncbi:GNAT family N-acetyltransferase [Fusibacter bizertensis]